MPKTINTPRNELLCGKVEAAQELLDQLFKCSTNSKSYPLIAELQDALLDIKNDGLRMEHKLASRKAQVRELRTALCGYKLAVQRAINTFPARVAPYSYDCLQEVDGHLRNKGDAFLQHDDGTWPRFDFD